MLREPDGIASTTPILDPSDEEFVLGFNILAAHSDWEKNLLASDLVAVFRRLSAAWGDQLNSVLSNALLAFMESDRGGTLLDVRRFLLEPGFRAEFLKSVRDPNVVYYWQRAFVAVSLEEAKAKEEQALKLMAELMRTKKRN